MPISSHGLWPNQRQQRRLSLLPGKLVFGPELMTLDCSIRDRSDSGVRVRLPAPEPLPNTLWFLDLRAGCAYEAEVAWRRLPEVGLIFRAPLDLAADPSPPAKVLARLLREAGPRDTTLLAG